MLASWTDEIVSIGGREVQGRKLVEEGRGDMSCSQVEEYLDLMENVAMILLVSDRRRWVFDRPGRAFVYVL